MAEIQQFTKKAHEITTLIKEYSAVRNKLAFEDVTFVLFPFIRKPIIALKNIKCSYLKIVYHDRKDEKGPSAIGRISEF